MSQEVTTPGRVQGGFAEAAGEQIAEAGEGLRVKHRPAYRPSRVLAAKKKPSGIALSRVVIARPGERIVEVNRLSQTGSFVMEPVVCRCAYPAQVGFEQDETSLGRQHTPGFMQKYVGSGEVMNTSKRIKCERLAETNGSSTAQTTSATGCGKGRC